MMMRHLFLPLAAAVVGYAGVTAAAAASKRVFTIAAVEPKGTAEVAKEPFPAAALPDGGGLQLKKPGDDGRWQISAYLWSAPQYHVKTGDEQRRRFRPLRSPMAAGFNSKSPVTTAAGRSRPISGARRSITSKQATK